jgi:hypothetical protein
MNLIEKPVELLIVKIVYIKCIFGKNKFRYYKKGNFNEKSYNDAFYLCIVFVFGL